jgi:two-component system sensor histidine kinase YesM
MKRLRNLNLYTKLVIGSVLLVAVPFIISNQVLNSMATQNIKQNTMTYIKLFADQISSNIDSFVSEQDRMTKTTIANKPVCDALQKSEYLSPSDAYYTNEIIYKHLFDLSTQQPNVRSVILVNEQGKAFLSGISKTIINYDAFEQFTRLDEIAGNDGKITVVPAHRPDYLFESDKKPAFVIGRLIKNQNYQAVGKLILLIDSSVLLDVIHINPALIKSGARIVVATNRGEIIADTHSSFEEEATGGRFIYDDYALDSRYVSFNTLSAYSGLSVSIVIPTATLFSSAESFRQYTLIITVFLMLCIIVIALYLSHRIVKPVKALQKSTDEVRSGNFKVRTNIHSTDEIGSLARSFDMMVDKIEDLVQNIYISQIRNKQAQLEALQSQINPHFLHNTLESIRMKAVINGDPEVAKMIRDLGKLFRITLDRKSNVVLIRDELEHVRAYLDIQNIRYENRFDLQIDLNDSIANSSIIKLVFQPIVENSIIHGFENNKRSGVIKISGYTEGCNIVLSICDNGDGMDIGTLSALNHSLADTQAASTDAGEHKSIGLRNISNRLILAYGAESALKIDSVTGAGTTVTLVIPRTVKEEDRDGKA